MTSRTKRKANRPPAAAEPSAEPEAEGSSPRPSPPQPNKRLLQISAILLFVWFGFLAWMAFFS